LTGSSARLLALAWLAVVVLAVGYLVVRFHDSLPLRTDLLALLPREDRDLNLQQANDAVSRALARRVVMLVGHVSPREARDAAGRLLDNLMATGLMDPVADGFDGERLKRLGALYFPYRRGLLAEADRALLAAGQGEEVATKALAQAFGVGGIADGSLLRADPFLLLPSFLADLPFPLSRLRMEDGVLTVTDGDMTWVLVMTALRGEPFALDVQERLLSAFNFSLITLRAAHPGLQIKRLGAVFFAEAGSRTATGEASTLATASLAGTILLIIVVFRRLRPLLLNLLVVGVGISAALAGSLAVFGELHVAALLFGTSLIGVSVDYGLYYTSSVFDPAGGTPDERLHRVMPGIVLGLLTTLLGYGALALAPFPGLRQIAVFSIIGLLGAFATVVLWLPALDTGGRMRHVAGLLNAASGMFSFWEAPNWRCARALLLLAAVTVTIAGLLRFETDNDVRRMQALSPELLGDQEDIRRLIGTTAATQFLLIEGVSDEAALRREEAVAPILARLKAEGMLSGSQIPAAFVPSAERQRENQSLVRTRLVEPLLARQRAKLGLEGDALDADVPNLDLLTLGEALASQVVPFLRELVLAPGLHVVALQGLTRPDAVRAAFADAAGVRFVDPTADFSTLLSKYQQRALELTGLSAMLMFGALTIRYGWKGAAWVMVPSVIAVLLAPTVLILAGQVFTFFHAMAVVLLLSITSDYAIFCAESPTERRAVTLLAVWMAALTTLLSFGLLAGSRVPAVYNFGSTMLIGILVAFFTAPLASRGRRKTNAPPVDKGLAEDRHVHVV
jgi:predicted exporter